MYIGITGTLASGKGEVVRILKKEGFVHYGFGDLIREELRKASKEPNVTNSTDYANELRAKHGADYLARVLLQKAERETPRHAVFESIRTPAELKTLRHLPGFVLLSIDAPREQRWQWLQNRGRGDGFKSFEEFCAEEDKQLDGKDGEQQLYAVMDEADVKVVNIGNLEELRDQIFDELNLKRL